MLASWSHIVISKVKTRLESGPYIFKLVNVMSFISLLKNLPGPFDLLVCGSLLAKMPHLAQVLALDGFVPFRAAVLARLWWLFLTIWLEVSRGTAGLFYEKRQTDPWHCVLFRYSDGKLLLDSCRQCGRPRCKRHTLDLDRTQQNDHSRCSWCIWSLGYCL